MVTYLQQQWKVRVKKGNLYPISLREQTSVCQAPGHHAREKRRSMESRSGQSGCEKHSLEHDAHDCYNCHVCQHYHYSWLSIVNSGIYIASVDHWSWCLPPLASWPIDMTDNITAHRSLQGRQKRCGISSRTQTRSLSTTMLYPKLSTWSLRALQWWARTGVHQPEKIWLHI